MLRGRRNGLLWLLMVAILVTTASLSNNLTGKYVFKLRKVISIMGHRFCCNRLSIKKDFLFLWLLPVIVKTETELVRQLHQVNRSLARCTSSHLFSLIGGGWSCLEGGKMIERLTNSKSGRNDCCAWEKKTMQAKDRIVPVN